MPTLLLVSPHLSHDEVVQRFKGCAVVGERLRWQAVMLKFEGRTAKDIADICKRREDWVRRTIRAYNQGGPEALVDGRRANGREGVLNEALCRELSTALLGNSPDGGFWTGAKVAAWIEEKTGTSVNQHTGWLYLVKSGFTRQLPRPKHPEADKEAQDAFKKGGFRAVLTSSFENIPASRSRSGRRTKPDSD